MNDFDNDLQKALQQNGGLAAETAEVLKTNVRSKFHRAWNRVTRGRLLTNGILCVLFFLFFGLFQGSDDTKAQILYATLMLVMTIGLVWTKAWFWMTRTRMQVLKEIWLVRLGTTEPYDESEAFRVGSRLSKAERVLWDLGTVVAVAAVLVCAQLGVFRSPAKHYFTQKIVLESDGSGTQTTHQSGPVHRGEPQSAIAFQVGGKVRDPENYAWFDGQGRRLSHELAVEGEESRFAVQLVEPLVSGQWPYTRAVYQSASMASKDGQSWVFRRTYVYGFPVMSYRATIVLPPGARIESTVPEAGQQLEVDGRPAVVLEADRESREAFTFEVRYHLP